MLGPYVDDVIARSMLMLFFAVHSFLLIRTIFYEH